MVTVVTTVVGMIDPLVLDWPDNWPLPHLDAAIYVPSKDGEDAVTMFVREIIWYPHGGVWNYRTDQPYVYLVVGPRRRS